MILERSKLNLLINKPDELPSVEQLDTEHKKWRDGVIKEAEDMGLLFTHGVAAKLINIYFKTVFICGGYDANDKVKTLHPPIDSVLLKSLRDKDVGAKKKQWGKAVNIKWSKFTSNQYQSVIDDIREVLNGKPLWKIEEHWQGFQSKTANPALNRTLPLRARRVSLVVRCDTGRAGVYSLHLTL
jgi:hypothetical protein